MTALDWQRLADAFLDHDATAAAPLLAQYKAEHPTTTKEKS